MTDAVPTNDETGPEWRQRAWGEFWEDLRGTPDYPREIGSGKLIIPDAMLGPPPEDTRDLVDALMTAVRYDSLPFCEAVGYFSPTDMHLHCEMRTHPMSEHHQMWSRPGSDEPSTLIRWKDGRVEQTEEDDGTWANT